MPFFSPDFHLLCDIWTANASGDFGTLRAANVPCQLVYSRPQGNPVLKLAAKTDIRPSSQGPGAPSAADLVICPSGTNNTYIVGTVSDVARGYANEYRIATLARAFSHTAFPIQ